MLRNILIHENSTLETATVQYAKMGMAVADAFRGCWKTKYLFNCVRPISYIQANIDPAWVPLISTPPFPEYSSGHSTQSGAMSKILEDFLGTSYAFVDSAHGANFGGPRSFVSFEHAAEEAAISRLYGGIHFEFGNESGLVMGRKIGENINKLFTFATSSLDELSKSSLSMVVYPNPATDAIRVVGQNFNVSEVEIYDLRGQKIHLNNSAQEINISELASGMYIVYAFDASKSVRVQSTFLKN